jgi:hypothetical protein
MQSEEAKLADLTAENDTYRDLSTSLAIHEPSPAERRR